MMGWTPLARSAAKLALELQARSNHNKATCALANKLARIAWAVWVKHERYQPAAAWHVCAWHRLPSARVHVPRNR